MSANRLAAEAVAVKVGVIATPMQDSALAALTKYIPTESVTLYVATVSALPALKETLPGLHPSQAYWFFVILSPLLLLLLYWRQLATAGKSLGKLAQWPYWRMIASTIAFGVWALAVPSNGIISGNGAAVLAALGALLVSTVLNLVEPIFERLSPN